MGLGFLAFLRRKPHTYTEGVGMGKPEVLTVGDAARLLQVAPRTIAKWCDSGRIAHYRLPAGNRVAGDRRILYSDLAAFCAANGIPLAKLEGTPCNP